eukprot:6174736-Pleurochrysis_carterae.AAC.1
MNGMSQAAWSATQVTNEDCEIHLPPVELDRERRRRSGYLKLSTRCIPCHGPDVGKSNRLAEIAGVPLVAALGCNRSSNRYQKSL